MINPYSTQSGVTHYFLSDGTLVSDGPLVSDNPPCTNTGNETVTLKLKHLLSVTKAPDRSPF